MIDLSTKDGKILHYIHSGSTVLEFSAGYGRLTKYMKEELNCKVYITENDKDAYNESKRYAVKGINEDISNYKWEKEFKNISFDYIILSDNLSYLENPSEIIKKLLKLLKEDGSIFISVPNIAHNSVIINLVNNKFDYKDIGLLRKEYKKYYTYNSLIDLIESCNLIAEIQDGTVCIPANTEFKTSYNDIDGNTDILKYRQLADIYYFVFKCIKKNYYYKHKDSIQVQKLLKNISHKDMKLCEIYFDTGSDFNGRETIKTSIYFKYNQFEVDIDIPPKVKRLRFDPIEGSSCIISNLNIISDKRIIEHSSSNGFYYNDIFTFDNTDPHIVIDFNNENYNKICIKGYIFIYNIKDYDFINKIKKVIEDNSRLISENNILTTKNLELINTKDYLIEEIKGLKNDIQVILNTLSWKITAPLRIFRDILNKNKNNSKKDDIINNSYEISYKDRYIQEKTAFSKNIIISIITPLYNTPNDFLTEMIESVIAQTYNNWELCLADGSDAQHKYIQKICKKYSKKDKRIKYKKLEKNEGIAINSNKAIEMTTGQYIGLLDHDDILHPSALFEVMKTICEKNADFIYSDENSFYGTPQKSDVPHFKPDYSPDTLRSYNYICHFTVFKKELLNRIGGGFKSEFDGSQDYELILRLTEAAVNIFHIPSVLYFWRTHKDSTSYDVSTKPYIITAAKNAISHQLERLKLKGEVIDSHMSSTYRIKYEIKDNPLISILIPNMDYIEDLSKCINSITIKTTYKNYEIIIIENNSKKTETFEYYKKITKENKNIKIVNWKYEFNYSAINNFGAEHANGDYFILLNNDIEIITPDWIQEMLMFAQRDDVGAVGPMLYYPDNTIQHAGVIIGLGGVAGHSHKHFPKGSLGYAGRLTIAQNLSAVTGACLMIRKNVFHEINGFDESLKIAFNDIDLCMKVRNAGYLIVWTPYSEAYHHESKSRGYEDTIEKKIRLDNEKGIFVKKWEKEIQAGDPYYNPNLTLDREDFSLK